MSHTKTNSMGNGILIFFLTIGLRYSLVTYRMGMHTAEMMMALHVTVLTFSNRLM